MIAELADPIQKGTSYGQAKRHESSESRRSVGSLATPVFDRSIYQRIPFESPVGLGGVADVFHTVIDWVDVA